MRYFFFTVVFKEERSLLNEWLEIEGKCVWADAKRCLGLKSRNYSPVAKLLPGAYSIFFSKIFLHFWWLIVDRFLFLFWYRKLSRLLNYRAHYIRCGQRYCNLRGVMCYWKLNFYRFNIKYFSYLFRLYPKKFIQNNIQKVQN